MAHITLNSDRSLHLTSSNAPKHKSLPLTRYCCPQNTQQRLKNASARAWTSLTNTSEIFMHIVRLADNMPVAAYVADVASTGQGHHPTHQYGRDFSSAVVGAEAGPRVVVEIVMLYVVSGVVEAACTV